MKKIAVLYIVLSAILLIGSAQTVGAQSSRPSKRTTISPRKKPVAPAQTNINVNFKGDLGRFALKGPVKNLKLLNNDESIPGPEYYFNRDGFEIDSDGHILMGEDNNYVKYTRDSQGRLIVLDELDFINFKEEYVFNSNGLLLKKRWTNYSGSNKGEDCYTYNSEGECVSCSSVYFQLGEHGKETIKYTILMRDKYGNWTKRKDQHGNIEKRAITYYE